jgi:hypothetical protein
MLPAPAAVAQVQDQAAPSIVARPVTPIWSRPWRTVATVGALAAAVLVIVALANRERESGQLAQAPPRYARSCSRSAVGTTSIALNSRARRLGSVFLA